MTPDEDKTKVPYMPPSERDYYERKIRDIERQEWERRKFYEGHYSAPYRDNLENEVRLLRSLVMELLSKYSSLEIAIEKALKPLEDMTKLKE